MQCLCLQVPCAQALGSLCPLLPDHLSHPPSDPFPEVPPAGGRFLGLIFFGTLLFFVCVFLKICYNQAHLAQEMQQWAETRPI